MVVTHDSSLEIKYVAIDELIPYVNNARTHTDEQVKQIASSIKEFGWTNPVLIDGDNGVIAGHGRLLAGQKLGIDKVPTIELQGLTEAQKKAYILADNRLAQNAGWDEDLLKLELQDLESMDFDMTLMGFELAELNKFLTEETEGLTDPDEIPEVEEEATTLLGDVWVLGEHRVMCGDSTDAESVAYLLDGAKVALIHADPPYGMGKEKDGVINDNLYANKLDAFQMAWWNAVRSNVNENASAYIWGNSPDLWRLWYSGGLCNSERLTIRNEIVWQQEGASWGRSAMEGLRQFATNGERALFFMLGEQGFNNNSDNYWEGWENIRSYLYNECKKMGWNHKDIKNITGVGMYNHWFTESQWTMIPEKHYKALQASAKGKAFLRPYDNNYNESKQEHDGLKQEHDGLKQEFYATRAYFNNTHDNGTDIWQYDRVKGEERHGHATPKPVAMMEKVMKSSLTEGGICYEPFAGSGSTLMGAERTGRKCYTMELAPTYCDVIIKRWQDFTGKQATLENTNKTFEQIQEERNGISIT